MTFSDSLTAIQIDKNLTEASLKNIKKLLENQWDIGHFPVNAGLSGTV